MILYLDSHLLEDTEFFIRLSSAFTEILQTVRHYAYPAIVYKIVLYNFLHPTATIATAPTPRPVAPTPSPAPSSVVAPVATPIVDQKPEAPAPIVGSVSETSGPQDILIQLIARIDKDNLKHALQDHASIVNHENGMITLSIINKMSQMMIDNTENKATIESILADILGEKTFIQTTFVSKESLFQGGLL